MLDARVPVAQDARTQHVGHDVMVANGGEPGAEADMMKRLCMQHARGLRVVTLAVLLSTACCAGANRGAGRANVELADRYERGDGVPRDFRKSVALLTRACADGRGIASACRRLALARARGRGAPVDPLSAGPLLAAACEHGDWLACGGPIPFDEAKARAACADGNHEACLAVDSLTAWNQSGTLDDERRRHVDAACRANVLEGCYAIPQSDPDTVDDRAALALQRLSAACRRGDVDACAAIGSPLPPRDLCDAGDFASCVAVDDPSALIVACDNQVAQACERLGLRGLEQEPPDPRAAEYLERACQFGASKACEYEWKPGELETGCAGFRTYIIAPDNRRAVPRLHGTDASGRPWIAPPERILLLVEKDSLPAPVYDEIASRIDVPVFVSIEAENAVARPPLQRATWIVVDPTIAGDHVVMGTHDLSAHRISRTNALIDPDGVVRAAFWGVPNSPVSFARCVRHVLTLL